MPVAPVCLLRIPDRPGGDSGIPIDSTTRGALVRSVLLSQASGYEF
jgi:hypothetical protein